MEKKVNNTIDYLVHRLRASQKEDGSWRYCFESGPMTDAYMIILLKSLNDQDENLMKKLVQRLLLTQKINGSWKLFYDEKEGNLSATIEAYFALLYSGYLNENEAKMLKTKSFILKNGGLSNAQDLTKVMLALTGQYPWPKYLQIPIEVILLPKSAPISLYELVGYARVHFIPILITSNLQFQLTNSHTPDISKLLLNDRIDNQQSDISIGLLEMIKKEVKKLIHLPKHIRNLSLQKAEQFMLERIEPDGTLYSYFSATFLMIFALLALGYPKDDPIIVNAINGLKSFVCKTKDFAHVQNSTSTVWDTALISHSLQKAGVSETDPIILKAGNYLLKKQHTKYGDWIYNNPEPLPGGWGFSDSNTINPDVDDTTATLRAIKKLASRYESYQNSWSRGVHWLITMQNNDGGWPAFEKNTDNSLVTLLPIDEAKRAFIDPSTTDLTGRTLEFLGHDANLNVIFPQIKVSARWLLRNQERDGSWYGRWGISYIYGTWAAITGLRAVGIDKDHISIKKAVNWLLSVQNEDGGWGESCYSDIYKSYVPLHSSTPSQTAWALDTLISIFDQPTPEINKGMKQLVEGISDSSWKTDYPTGAGLPGAFYIHYHSYRYIWPLLSLSNYRNKFM